MSHKLPLALLHELPPGPGNPRNSEGAFLRGRHGELLFAYSRYRADSNHDHAPCDIALITSEDEGEHWSEPRLIARAQDFGTQNIMSVSAMPCLNGDLAFYFLIKENDFTTTLGRTVSYDGIHFTAERCDCRFPPAYYVVNNDRLVRLADGRIVAPASYITAEQNRNSIRCPMIATFLISSDDGKTFRKTEWEGTTSDPVNERYGLQETGIYQRTDGEIYIWARTGYGCQYEWSSSDALVSFTAPRASGFTAPPSPMQIKAVNGTVYAIYNPIPNYNGRETPLGCWGRTPLVIRKSDDDGRTFGPLCVIEDDPTRGYCYPAIFPTADGDLLLAYCRGNAQDGNTLCRLGIAKIKRSDIL